MKTKSYKTTGETKIITISAAIDDNIFQLIIDYKNCIHLQNVLS